MRILKYLFETSGPDAWSFSETALGKVNLLVGDSGSGKTRFLNTLFNLGQCAIGIHPLSPFDHWHLTFEHEGIPYEWSIRTGQSSDGQTIVTQERLSRTDSTPDTLVSRTSNRFRFRGKDLPKLRSDSLSISILKEEDTIRPLYEGFSLVLRRNFFSDALQNVIPTIVPQIDLLKKPIGSLNELHRMNLPLNLKLFFLSKNFPESYDQICKYFTSIFPFFTAVEIKDWRDLVKVTGLPPGPVPVFCVREKYVKKWVGVDQLSSGIQKVLLIITDALTLPNGSIYIIDEYENSLGVSAIDFIPELLERQDKEIQYLITSHHPYLINNIPVENWLVFHRKGSKIQIRYGSANMEAYGKSKQQRFIQLINDPFFSEAVCK